MANQILFPAFVLIVYTHVVMVIMFLVRVKALKTGKVDARYFKTYDSGNLPRNAAQVSRQYANLMEMPILFYLVSVVFFVQNRSSDLILVLCWVYVALRIGHGLIHMTSNKLTPRLYFFASSTFLNLGLWFYALFL